MVSRGILTLFVAWAMFAAPIASAILSAGCPRCAEHCPMHAEGSKHEMPCHGGGHTAAKGKPGGCTIRSGCPHASASLPAAGFDAVLARGFEVASPSPAISAVWSPTSTPTTRTSEPPTDPPRLVVAA